MICSKQDILKEHTTLNHRNFKDLNFLLQLGNVELLGKSTMKNNDPCEGKPDVLH